MSAYGDQEPCSNPPGNDGDYKCAYVETPDGEKLTCCKCDNGTWVPDEDGRECAPKTVGDTC